jgi:iron(III) transport system ATP-binding protein
LGGQEAPALSAAASLRAKHQRPRVSVRNVTKRFQTKAGSVAALTDVSMEVEAGERLVLLGPSGCGKTTLLRCIAGLERPDEGEIYFDDFPVFSSSKQIFVVPERRDISMMFQSYALWPHMSVERNVAFPLESKNVPKQEIDARVQATLAMVGCSGLSTRHPAQLSGGQQQRVALARAIIGGDKVILFDEPLSNVDAKVREALRVELTSLQRQLGFSTVYVTHDQIEATAIADRIAVFDHGRLAQVGSARDIYARPATAYVAEFIGSTNPLSGIVAKYQNDEMLEIDSEIGMIRAKASRGVPGDKVRLLIRPEHITLWPSDLSSAPNVFPARIETVMFTGMSTEYAVLIGQTRVIARAMSSDAFQENQAVCVKIDPGVIMVFPN